MNDEQLKQLFKEGIRTPSTKFTGQLMQNLEPQEQIAITKWHYKKTFAYFLIALLTSSFTAVIINHINRPLFIILTGVVAFITHYLLHMVATYKKLLSST